MYFDDLLSPIEMCRLSMRGGSPHNNWWTWRQFSGGGVSPPSEAGIRLYWARALDHLHYIFHFGAVFWLRQQGVFWCPTSLFWLRIATFGVCGCYLEKTRMEFPQNWPDDVSFPPSELIRFWSRLHAFSQFLGQFDKWNVLCLQIFIWNGLEEITTSRTRWCLRPEIQIMFWEQKWEKSLKGRLYLEYWS